MLNSRCEIVALPASCRRALNCTAPVARVLAIYVLTLGWKKLAHNAAKWEAQKVELISVCAW